MFMVVAEASGRGVGEAVVSSLRVADVSLRWRL